MAQIFTAQENDQQEISIHDIDFICKHFRVGRLITLHKPVEGTVNMNLPIETTTGKYVCKFFHAEKERINCILDAMKILRENNIPVSIPLRDTKKKYYLEWKNLAVQLTPYIKGYPFSNESSQMLSSGKTLRRFHRALKNFNELSDPIASIYPSSKILEKGLTQLNMLNSQISNNEIHIINKLYNKIIGDWEIVSKDLPQTVIHGDWNERNQRFTSSGKVCCIFDFEFIQRRERIFDIAYVLWNFMSHHKLHFLVEPFLKGYGHLTEREENILQMAIARISIFFLCTAALAKNPILEVNTQYKEQIPFIQYILSNEGQRRLRELWT